MFIRFVLTIFVSIIDLIKKFILNQYDVYVILEDMMINDGLTDAFNKYHRDSLSPGRSRTSLILIFNINDKYNCPL